MTPQQERQLIDAITKAFGNSKFDTSSIVSKANYDTALAAAIDAAIPGASRHSKRQGLHFRELTVQRVLKPLSNKYFHTDELGWWSARIPSKSENMTQPDVISV